MSPHCATAIKTAGIQQRTIPMYGIIVRMATRQPMRTAKFNPGGGRNDRVVPIRMPSRRQTRIFPPTPEDGHARHRLTSRERARSPLVAGWQMVKKSEEFPRAQWWQQQAWDLVSASEPELIRATTLRFR